MIFWEVRFYDICIIIDRMTIEAYIFGMMGQTLKKLGEHLFCTLKILCNFELNFRILGKLATNRSVTQNIA